MAKKITGILERHKLETLPQLTAERFLLVKNCLAEYFLAKIRGVKIDNAYSVKDISWQEYAEIKQSTRIAQRKIKLWKYRK